MAIRASSWRGVADPATLPPSSVGHGIESDRARVPGVVVVFTRGAPAARIVRLVAGGVELGRGADGPGTIDDGRISRRHARVEVDGTRCLVTDLGSQNGTHVDGTLVAAHTPTPAERVVRIGDSLVVPCRDVRIFERTGVCNVDGFVRGPAMHAILDEAASAARSGTLLHIRGESGSGKEGVAHAFHRASPRAARPIVAVNCAAIPPAIAERLLFGAKRGAYSGADVDAVGYIEEADGGTLFLDEVAELDLHVQAKLLRVLESRELMPVGASRPRKVDLGFCSATNKDLRALVAAGLLREDLYFRIGRPLVSLPPLRDRPEEIPVLIAGELARRSPAATAHVSLVEQCLLRAWPGNVRELLSEIRTAARTALAEGGSDTRVGARHLAATAGSVFGSAMPDIRPIAPPADANGADANDVDRQCDRHRRTPDVGAEWRRRIDDALASHAGNVTAAARALGLHRTQLRRLIARLGVTATVAQTA